MEVSAKKSQIIAGRPAVAKAIAIGIASQKLSAAAHAKLLGTDFVGGGEAAAPNISATASQTSRTARADTTTCASQESIR